MERAGRRKLMSWGVIGMFFSAILLTICLVAKSAEVRLVAMRGCCGFVHPKHQSVTCLPLIVPGRTVALQDSHPSTTKSLGILSIVFVMLFVTFFELGPGT